MIARGYAKVPNTVLQDPRLGDGAVRVYAVLLGLRPEHDGTVLATHDQLADACGHRRRWAVERVRELATANLIEWRRGGKARPNRHRLLDVVPARRERVERVLEVAAQPKPEPLDIGRVLEAELTEHAGVGLAPAREDSAHGPAGLPHGARRDLAVGALHAPDSRSGTGEQGGEPW